MKRHQCLIKLSKDHHQGLIVAQLLKKDAPKFRDLPDDLNGKTKYAINFYENELKNHFALEENILIPFILKRNKNIDVLCNQILEEHKVIFNKFEDIKNYFDEDKLDKIGILLSRHIRKEERELFELIQENFSDEELNQLDEKFNKN
ncbi:MAG: hypothetical protein STSR0008_25290 [Ignavibacterium sp.]